MNKQKWRILRAPFQEVPMVYIRSRIGNCHDLLWDIEDRRELVIKWVAMSKKEE